MTVCVLLKLCRAYGPCFTTWSFGFERAGGALTGHITGFKNCAMTLVKRYTLIRAFSCDRMRNMEDPDWIQPAWDMKKHAGGGFIAPPMFQTIPVLAGLSGETVVHLGALEENLIFKCLADEYPEVVVPRNKHAMPFENDMFFVQVDDLLARVRLDANLQIDHLISTYEIACWESTTGRYANDDETKSLVWVARCFVREWRRWKSVALNGMRIDDTQFNAGKKHCHNTVMVQVVYICNRSN